MSVSVSRDYRGAADTLLRESGCTVRSWRKSMTGRAYTRSEDWGIDVPEPRGPISFATLAHEVGHQLLHRSGSKQRWQEEVEAWEYALEQFDRFNLAGKERAEDDAARSIGYAFLKASRISRNAAKRILVIYPEWWTRAEQVDAKAMRHPAMSRERRELDHA